jgi:hypothetical protein
LIAVSKRWVMAAAPAMAALKAMALGDCGGTTATAATALVTIALVALVIAHFVSCTVIANAITHVVTIAITFVSMQQRGQW